MTPRKTFLLIALILICITLLFSCKDECEEHKDGDLDGSCDECGQEVKAEEPAPPETPESPEEPAVPETPEEPDTPEDPVCTHNDDNRDGKCDLCKKAMEGALALISLGKTEFTFVTGSGIGGNALRAIDKLALEMEKLGVEVETVTDKANTVTEYEVLFGEIKTRGEEYAVDMHSYGLKGYTIRIVGNKIIVSGGSEESMLIAINKFREEILGITDKTVRLVNRYVYPDQAVSFVQSDYKVSSVTLFGEDIRDYKIFADKSAVGDVAVKRIQNLFYENTGYWLEHSSAEPAEGERGIYITLVERCGDDGFAITFEEGRITVASEYITSIQKEPAIFFRAFIEGAEGTLDFDAQDSLTKNTHCVYYEDFGAVGDGVTNDAEAIISAHQYAAEGGHKKVVGKSGAVYYIAEMSSSALITCDVDWTGAKFIIDDSVIKKEDANSIVFHVPGSGYKSISPSKSETITAINENGGIVSNNINKLDLGLGYEALLIVYNTSHKNYVRYGPNKNEGDSQAEIVLVDAEGNIDPSTPFMLDYEKITSIAAYRIDDAPLTIEGGEITTVANNQSGTYYSRGIYISRSNVTVRNLSHYIVGEGEVGSPYGYFTDISYAHNLLFENCVYSGHKTYYSSGGIGKGSYDITTHYASHVTWKNCNQINFFTEDGAINSDVWGVMGGGHSKNISFIGSRLNRFDAHSGVLNAYIVDCEIVNITVVGGGDLLVQNSKVHNIFLIKLRDDYGSFWHGDITIKDVTMVSNDPCYILNGHWYNHDFGYATAMPRNITIDGLKIEGTNKKVSIILSAFRKELDKSLNDEFTSTGTDGSTIITPNVNKTMKTESITVKNNTAGLEFVFPTTSAFFADTVMTEIPFEG